MKMQIPGALPRTHVVRISSKAGRYVFNSGPKRFEYTIK